MPENIVRCTFGYECNDNCIYCTLTPNVHKYPPIVASDIPKFLERLSAIGDAALEISGGEPTIKPETFYFLERLHEAAPAVRCTVLTNGRMFSKISMAAKLSNFPPHRLVVPIHADTPQIHDFITQVGGSFGETLLGIKNLYEYNLPVDLKVVVSKQNYERLPKLVELLAQKFPDCAGIITNRVIFDSGRSLKNRHLAAVRLSDTLPHVEKAIEIGRTYGFKVWVYSVPPCMLREEYRKSFGELHHAAPVKNSSDGFRNQIARMHRTAKQCKCCRFFSACGDVWGSYFDFYGTDEINPIL